MSAKATKITKGDLSMLTDAREIYSTSEAKYKTCVDMLEKAKIELAQARGASNFSSVILAKKYSLLQGDQITDDGLIIRQIDNMLSAGKDG